MTSAKISCRRIPSQCFPVDIISATTQLTTSQRSKHLQQLYHFQIPAQDMSLLRIIATRAPRAPLAATTATKSVRFSTSPFAQKDSGSGVKDTIDSVNKTVGDAAVKGIEKGRECLSLFFAFATTIFFRPLSPIKQETPNADHPQPTEQASENLKSTVGLNAKQAEGSAKEMSGEAKGKASELAGEAKGKTQEVAGQAKGKAEEIKGKM